MTITVLLVLYKVMHVPITHDETATTVHYSNFTAWEIMMYPDNWPNNHILNTLATKFLIAVFGKSQIVVRLPSLFGLFIFLYAVRRLLSQFFSSKGLMSIAGLLLFVANPYFLDFFGLCRGYALAASFATLSVSFLISGSINKNERHLWVAYILAILASYANFTLLLFWGATSIYLAIYHISVHRKCLAELTKKLGALAVVGVCYMALIITPLRKMTSSGQFEYWSSNGFFKGTVFSLVESWKYGAVVPLDISTATVASIVVGLFILSWLLVLVRWFSVRSEVRTLFSPMSVGLTVLSVTVLVNILQCWIMDTPDLFGRTGLFLYPLFAIVILGLLQAMQKKGNYWLNSIVALALSVILIGHFAKTYSHKNVREWWFDENTLEVLDYLDRTRGDNPVSLKTHWLFHPSFHFYTVSGKTPWLHLHGYDKEIDITTDAKYYYLESADAEILEKEFDRVAVFNSRWLLKRKSQP